MPLSNDDIQLIRGVTTDATRAAISQEIVPLRLDIAEIKARLNAGAETMSHHERSLSVNAGVLGEHGEQLVDHEGRLKAHQGILDNHEARLPKPERRAASEPSPKGVSVLRSPWWEPVRTWLIRHALMAAFKGLITGISAIAALALWAIHHGAPIPGITH